MGGWVCAYNRTVCLTFRQTSDNCESAENVREIWYLVLAYSILLPPRYPQVGIGVGDVHFS